MPIQQPYQQRQLQEGQTFWSAHVVKRCLKIGITSRSGMQRQKRTSTCLWANALGVQDHRTLGLVAGRFHRQLHTASSQGSPMQEEVMGMTQQPETMTTGRMQATARRPIPLFAVLAPVVPAGREKTYLRKQCHVVRQYQPREQVWTQDNRG